MYLLEHAGREEEGIRVEQAENLFLVGWYDRLQLEHVANEQELLSPEWQAHVARVDPQDAVDAIDDIHPYHRYLVDDDQLGLRDDFPFLLRVLKELEDAAVR